MDETQALHEAADRMNEELRAAERLLEGLALGVSAEVDLGDGNILGFKKLPEGWRLYVRSRGEGDVSPLVKAPRHVRVAASARLEDLLSALRDAVGTSRAAVEDALVKVKSFNERLRGRA